MSYGIIASVIQSLCRASMHLQSSYGVMSCTLKAKLHLSGEHLLDKQRGRLDAYLPMFVRARHHAC